MNNFIRNLFEPEAPNSIGTKTHLRGFELFTVAYSIIYAWKWGFYILHLSDVVLPLGLVQYIDVQFFFGNNLVLINAVLISVCTLVPFVFKKVRWLYGAAFLLLHLQFAVRFSQGEIPHSSNLVGFSLLGLGLGGIFLRDIKKSLPFALGFVLFFTGLGYTTAGFSKLIGTGLTWPAGNHLWLWIAEKGTDVLSKTGSFQYNWLQEIALQNRLSATLILVTGWITEFSAFLLWWKRYRVIIFTMLIVMHIGIYLSMNILFLPYMIELAIIGYPWNRFFNYAAEQMKLNVDHPVLRWIYY